MRSRARLPTFGALLLALAMALASCGGDSGPSERGVRSFIESYEAFDDAREDLLELGQEIGDECLAVFVSLSPISAAAEAPFLGDQLELLFPDLDNALSEIPGLAPSEIRAAMETLSSKSRDAYQASVDQGGFASAEILDTPEYDDARREVRDWLEANCAGIG